MRMGASNKPALYYLWNRAGVQVFKRLSNGEMGLFPMRGMFLRLPWDGEWAGKIWNMFQYKLIYRILLCLLVGFGFRLPLSGMELVESRISELNRLFSWIYACPEDVRWNASDSFLMEAKAVMEAFEGQDFPFERVRNLNYFKAGNGDFRMLNWGIPSSSGTVSYKALLQVRRKSRGDYVIYDLSDMSVYQPYPEQLELDPQSWWGAFYYQCIEQEAGGRTYYTFLGWNAGQELYQQSVIEVMTVKPDGQVRFGASLFVNRGRIPGSDRVDKSIRDQDVKRVVFRFSKRTGMILRYDYQTYVTRNARGKRVEKKDNMIIFDKLMPEQASMADDYAYYIPEGGRYQSFVFEGNKWRLQEEVIARNPEKRRNLVRRPAGRRF